jgi:alpha-1,2-mannosyltransferase
MTDPVAAARLHPFGPLTPLIAGFVLAFGFFYLARDFLILQDGLVISELGRLGRDFVNVWHGGDLALHNQAASLYDVEAYRESLWRALALKGIYAYSYPPHSLFLAVPLSLLPYWAALLLWTIVGLGLFVHAARPYLAAVGLPWWLAALLPAGFVNIWAAQYGFLVGALTLYGWRQIERQSLHAGLAFALMTVKPHLGLMTAFAMLLRGDWRTIGFAVATTAGLGTLAALLFGWDLWPAYLGGSVTLHANLLTGSGMAFHGMMPTLTAAVLRTSMADWIAPPAQIACALVAIWGVWKCVRARIPAMDMGLITSSAIFLVLPYAFIYDMTVYSLAALVFAARATGPAARTQRLVLAIAFILPLVQMSLTDADIWIAPLVLVAAFLVQVRIATATVVTDRDVPAGAGATRSA